MKEIHLTTNAFVVLKSLAIGEFSPNSVRILSEDECLEYNIRKKQEWVSIDVGDAVYIALNEMMTDKDETYSDLLLRLIPKLI